MMRGLYSLLFYCAMPLVLLRVYWRARKEPDYANNLRQRFGFVDPCSTSPVWVHAVSAGEMIAAVPLVERLLADGESVVVTNMTPTGRERCQALLGDKVHNYYVPYDLPDAVSRFIRSIKPKALIIIDTELWPNMLHHAATAGAKIFLVNGRLSIKSAAGYGRIGGVTLAMLNHLTRTFIQTQSQADRFNKLGLSNDNIMVTGSIKFDAQMPTGTEPEITILKAKFAEREIFLAASTHPGEETLILEALTNLRGTQRPKQNDKCLLIIAPRHTHRVDAVAKLIMDAGFKMERHSQQQALSDSGSGAGLDPTTDVYLLDTMGELIYFYAIADLAFVGGSLVDGIGGHNPMEPAALGVPILMGPYRRNVADIAEQFEAAGALLTIDDAASLTLNWAEISRDSETKQRMADASLGVMENNRGALDRVMKEIKQQLSV